MPSTRRLKWIAAFAAGALAAGMVAPTSAAEASVEDGIDLDDDSLKALGVYPILDDDMISSDADPEHVEVFERFSAMIPAELRPEVTHFVAIDGGFRRHGRRHAAGSRTPRRFQALEVVSRSGRFGCQQYNATL